MSVLYSPFRGFSILFLAILLSAYPIDAYACSGQSEPDVEGTIIVEQADYFYKPSERKYAVIIKDKKGKSQRFEIENPADPRLIPPDLITGMKVKIHGKKKTDKKTKKTKYVLNAKPTSSETGTAIEIAAGPQVAQAGAGPRSMVTVLVNFQSSAVPCSETQLDNILFMNAQSVKSAYERSSYGSATFVRDSNNDGLADIYRVTINYSSASSTCDYSTWMNAANSALSSQYGVNVANYSRRLYYFGAGVGACGWAGLGTLGTGWSIVNGNYCATGNGDIAAHELGHNESMHHSALDQDNNGASESEYGDTSDIMGYGGVGLRHFNAPHKIQMGWMPSGNIASPTSSGTFTLNGLELNMSGTQVIRVPRAASGGGNYFLSYRIDDGVLTGLPSGYKYATNIHWHNGGGGYTNYIRTLTDGQSFTDPVSGATFTQNSHNSTSASVTLSFQCVPHAPSVTFSPSNVNTNVPGSNANYTVAVMNNDSGCEAATFNLAAAVPAGWVASLSSATMALNAGASGSVSLNVQSPLGAADGRYSSGVSVTAVGHAAGNGSGTYTLDRTPPSAITNLTGSAAKGKNNLSWSAPSDGSGSGVASYRVFRNGVFLGNASVTSYVDSSITSGVTYTYTVTSRDALGNESAQSNPVSVTSSGKGGGKPPRRR